METGGFPFPGVSHAGYPEMVRRETRVKEDSGARPKGMEGWLLVEDQHFSCCLLLSIHSTPSLGPECLSS